jgi:hypothetical protein
MTTNARQQVEAALTALGMRLADIDASEPGWFVTVLVDGRPRKVWATDVTESK